MLRGCFAGREVAAVAEPRRLGGTQRDGGLRRHRECSAKRPPHIMHRLTANAGDAFFEAMFGNRQDVVERGGGSSGTPSSGEMTACVSMSRMLRVSGATVMFASRGIAALRVSTRTGRRPTGCGSRASRSRLAPLQPRGDSQLEKSGTRFGRERFAGFPQFLLRPLRSKPVGSAGHDSFLPRSIHLPPASPGVRRPRRRGGCFRSC